MLVFPTIKHLEQLAEHESVADALDTARSRKVLPVQPRVLVEGGWRRYCCRVSPATTSSRCP